MRQASSCADTPAVAVLLSTYNGERFLEALLDSLIAQDYPHLDLWVRDDGSSDRSLSVLERYAAAGKIARLQNGGNIGVVGSFLELLRSAGDEYAFYAFCDQDDVWYPDKVSAAIQTLQSKEEGKPLLYCGRLEYIDQQLSPLGLSPIPARMGLGNALVENVVTGCTAVINARARRALLERWPPAVQMHDWWLYLVVSGVGRVIYDSRAFIRYRLHDHNTIGASLNPLQAFSRKLIRFLRGDKRGVFSASAQAAAFAERYADCLSHEQNLLLERFLLGKHSLFRRIGLCCNNRVWRQGGLDNLLLKGLLLFNKY